MEHSKSSYGVCRSAEMVDKWVVALAASIDQTDGVNMLGSSIESRAKTNCQ